ncbi:80 kD MCM3-associated protein, putative [Anopheles sinensis]|uniref:80 kD MCM3-associated protein, putative n=1 Tax=Anopheles sinensis TaxID=74873 RepID=A0A084WAG5_ANOSI|nr:80 kD MCM3-associated protein, putative [Anopheles sinensis]
MRGSPFACNRKEKPEPPSAGSQTGDGKDSGKQFAHPNVRIQASIANWYRAVQWEAI